MSISGTDTAPARTGPAPAPDPLLVVRDLRVRFTRDGVPVHAVNGLSYSVAPGRTLAVIGESGSGKSVSSRALLGLLPESARITGSATFDGTELIGMPEREMRGRRGSDIAMVFQDPARSLNPTMRIGNQITEAVRVHADVDARVARERAVELLTLVRLPAPERRFFEYPHQLSGGMRQRVMIAIALAGQPRLLIADEATTALDVTTQAQIMELLAELQQRLGTAVVMISHDLGLAASYADDVLVMYAGRAVEYAPAPTLFGAVRMPYTAALLGAIPLLDRPSHTLLPVIPGQPPDLRALPEGCPFRPRCASSDDQCLTEPPLTEHEPGHRWACWHPEPGPGTDREEDRR
ncbi:MULTISPECIES: ABC transporter ATP-binding protein [Pseudonocardia]|uniref:Oligopeptide transport ATP-binding protein OppD n=2 Tax=Pseudonocardia TaxID=1847 RepID=A0A1Y2MXK7_PSEAH|nr:MULTISPECIES: ABC transporter ATP-binding protein [Pseudonocardia]OSY39709.1 Oligopeptide transport ATP-binding protein OppD [Pseudonocardia autotrophica]TDN72839.1 oligopeptide transport system ATP-binding protein [Pseudonocardia autotrophica]BBG03557.1 oligopeptide ABC transporter ATP-binding protein OppD [Pseudonocardia autotrophica]GEC28554.1 oligopeptide ABC transporter ATP-binding protein OppD [Pseudonocardia saturnea]